MSKILIFSAEEKVREEIKQMLGDRYDLILTDSIDQSKECIKNSDISLIFIESGKAESLLENVKSLHLDNTNLKIVALINRNDEQIAQEAINTGAYGCVKKPIKSDELIEYCRLI